MVGVCNLIGGSKEVLLVCVVICWFVDLRFRFEW